MAKACEKCGGVWFWSPWGAGPVVRCYSCYPPTGKAKALRGPGLLQDDYSILTPALVAKQIEEFNELGDLLMVSQDIGSGWTRYTRAIVLSIPRRPMGACRPSLAEVPAGLAIPRDQWVDNTVTVQPAVAAPVQVPATVAQRQGKRLSRAAKR